MINIDGAAMEGGGSIVRLACALAAITFEPVTVANIRAGRPKPGLRQQHLEGLKALAGLSGGRLEGAHEGSERVVFSPGSSGKADIEVQISTAGSVGLVFQTLAPLALVLDKPARVAVKGGATFGKYAPPLTYTKDAFLPLLKQMGYAAKIEIVRHGFYPVGGAEAAITLEPTSSLRPLIRTEFAAESVKVVSVSSAALQARKVAERQAAAAEEALAKLGKHVDKETVYQQTACPGSGIVALAHGSSSVIGADVIGELRKTAEEVGWQAGAQLVGTVGSGAAVDEHMADQLLLFMAMAPGKSEITVPAITSHARTNMWLIEKMTEARFSCIDGRPARIICQGRG
ncbi:MAG: RNA 3'-phosphate cyclase [Candidatus Aenigmarchaeota archaeon]|nr:RNA 3'-phosphate cyclase [Candidatus Aenigmarchaeota archaeon]